MTKSDNKNHPNVWVVVAPIFIIMLAVAGFLGLFLDSSNRMSGFLWGIGITIILAVIGAIGALCWEWIKKGANKGKLFPYMLIGFIAAIAISGLLAANLGKPSCEEQGDAPYNSCISYANDGFEATSTQRWHKFWSTLPVTVIIASLSAVIARNEMRKHQK